MVERDVPEQGYLTLHVQVTGDDGKHLPRVKCLFIVDDILHPKRRELTTKAAGKEDTPSPFDVIWEPEWVSQMPDEVPMRVSLHNVMTGEYLYDEIVVRVR